MITKNLATGSPLTSMEPKVMETTNLPKPIKMAFKAKDIVTKILKCYFAV